MKQVQSPKASPKAKRAIYSIQINPSQTLLLACVVEVGLAVYKLPSLHLQFVAVCKLPGLQSVCDFPKKTNWNLNKGTWLDDENFVLGNYDGIYHWRVSTAGCPNPKLSKIKTKPGMRVRSLCYNVRTTQIAVLSPGHLHCLDAGRLETVMTRRLPHPEDNCCLAIDEECQLYGVGSKVGRSYFASQAPGAFLQRHHECLDNSEFKSLIGFL